MLERSQPKLLCSSLDPEPAPDRVAPSHRSQQKTEQVPLTRLSSSSCRMVKQMPRKEGAVTLPCATARPHDAPRGLLFTGRDAGVNRHIQIKSIKSIPGKKTAKVGKNIHNLYPWSTRYCGLRMDPKSEVSLAIKQLK